MICARNTQEYFSPDGVQIKETDVGQPCTECNKCKEGFEPHNWRKNCKNCKCLRDGHEVVVEHGARPRLGLNSTHDTLDARSIGYTFVPPGLTTARQVEQYYSALPGHEVPKLGSIGETARLQRIVKQLPKQDLALTACKFVEDSVKTSYQDFVSARNEIALDVGIVKPAPPNTVCDGCNRNIPNQQLGVVAPRMGKLMWHPGCFKCTTCHDLLVDLAYCVFDDQIYCERHYAEMLKPRCEGCDEVLVVPPRHRSHSQSPASTPGGLDRRRSRSELELQVDGNFLDELDGVKRKKLERNSLNRRSRKTKKMNFNGNGADDALLSSSSSSKPNNETAKTLTAAANVLKNVNDGLLPPADGDNQKAVEPFWLIFSGEYTKAMNKDWHGQHFCCWQCDESLTGQRYVLRDDHPYCVSCYESVFANACEKCSRTIGIDSKDLSYKDKHWHEACFLCTTCGESLVDKQFGSKGDRIYCGRCYDEQFASRCDGCHEIFRAGTKKMEYKTRQWHEKCFCCCVCKVPIGTQSFIPREQEIYCAKCYEEKFATRCIKCNKVITSGGVTYKNEPWHRECFTCTHCSKSLAGERFTSRDEKPYCAECFGELFAKRCFACNKPITGIGGTKFISFEDRHWHNDCFFCASCRTSLVGRGFITDQDDIICPDCAKQKLM